MIVIVNYGLGNLASIKNMLKKIGYDSLITSEPEELLRADKIIIPGVGAFSHGMKNLSDKNLIPVLTRKVVEEKTPTLGICLGMQLMTSFSEEGNIKGLGWIEAETRRIKDDVPGLKVPHMGWADIVPSQPEHFIFKDSPPENRFYFVHSFAVYCKKPVNFLAKTRYGHEFDSMIVSDNIIGCQFHPEKSHSFGMRLLSNFVLHT